jgi:hypothetical protein
VIPAYVAASSSEKVRKKEKNEGSEMDDGLLLQHQTHVTPFSWTPQGQRSGPGWQWEVR